MKRVLFVILSCIFIFFVDFTSVNAYDTLPYWYSDSDKIGWYTDQTLTYDSNGIYGCGLSETNLDSYVDTGVEGWDDLLAPDYSRDTLGEDILNRCVSRWWATFVFNIPTYAIGATDIDLAANYTYIYNKPGGSGTAKFYEIDDSEVFLVWDTDNTDGSPMTSIFSPALWETVSMHEFGHAIGYIGHTTAGYNLMYYSIQQTYTIPTTQDKTHMNLVYANE